MGIDDVDVPAFDVDRLRQVVAGLVAISRGALRNACYAISAMQLELVPLRSTLARASSVVPTARRKARQRLAREASVVASGRPFGWGYQCRSGHTSCDGLGANGTLCEADQVRKHHRIRFVDVR